MKKRLLTLCLLAYSFAAFSQNGLEGIIVEKYYVSDANDATVNSVGGVLPVGSVTYRIYVDMLPGYNFQAVYGEDILPLGPSSMDHEWRMATTTLFFNNEDRGATTPNAINSNYLDDNTVMLDSWLSVGGAASNRIGILKTEDDGVNTVVNNDGVLQNNNPDAGIPLTQEDGMVSGTPGTVTFVGITNEVMMFDNQNDGTNGPVFSTINGSLACLGGCMGPDAIENKVLVAQITTDGIFSFKLNVQIGTPTGGVENYVAENATGSEIQDSSLIYDSSLITGLNQFGALSNLFFEAYPVPASDVINLRLNKPGYEAENSYTIHDLLGKVVLTKIIGATTNNYLEKIDISKLDSGLYLLSVNIDGERAVKRIVKL